MDNTKSNDLWFKIIITQCICIVMILASVLITKYFFKQTYKDLKEWYTQNVYSHTDISEVLQDEV